ncbi:NAD(P)-dependent oxidoreductase [Vicingus serpentipes]|uniref:NAD(P)-dependent oxidoreductase n=2 Tax=Vicingus serpentipes TaxID=1926625 RepID=A0A5C6RVV6_9FLAO|nr:NAD(P)-dependent oxidoreductase [Vicingus serpentipes]
MNMKIAVFGGTGFLGSYLVTELLERGYNAFALDINDSEHIPLDKFIKTDILDVHHLSQLFADHKFDVVYNLAGFASLEKAVENPVAAFQLNVMGNLNLIDLCVKHEVKHFVYASSAYAMSSKGSFYGLSKLSSEKIVEEYKEKYNLDYTILRYGSLYSERDFENNYIFNLVKNAIKTGEINHAGDGEEVREYIHAFDAAKLSADVIENEEHKNKHLVLTGVERIKRGELFKMINEILGDTLKINLSADGYKNHYKYTPYSFTAKTSQKLTPNPYVEMGQGLLACIQEANEILKGDE